VLAAESTVLSLDFCVRGWIKSEIYKRKVSTRIELLPDIVHAAPCIRNVKINSEKQHALFAHKLQCSLRVTVGF
jgi:hypothetical protein